MHLALQLVSEAFLGAWKGPRDIRRTVSVITFCHGGVVERPTLTLRTMTMKHRILLVAVLRKIFPRGRRSIEIAPSALQIVQVHAQLRLHLLLAAWKFLLLLDYRSSDGIGNLRIPNRSSQNRELRLDILQLLLDRCRSNNSWRQG